MDGEDQYQEKRLLIAQETDPSRKVDLMNELAWQVRHYDPQWAMELSQEAYQLASEDQVYARGQFYSLRTLITLNTLLYSKYEVALSLTNQALTLSKTIDEPLPLTHILESLGEIYINIGDYSLALTYLLQAIELSQQVGDSHTESMILNDLGIVYYETNDLARCITSFEQALQVAQRSGDVETQGRLLNNLGMVHSETGHYDQAWLYLQRALELTRNLGARQVESSALDNLGGLYLAQGEYDQALDCLQQAYRINQELGERYESAVNLINIARVYQKQQQAGPALAYLEQALAQTTEIDAKSSMIKCHKMMAEIYEEQGNLAQALRHFRQFHSLDKEVFNEQADQRFKTLQVIHETETAKKEAEIYRLKNTELQELLAQVKELSGLLPICANCKKIRDDAGYWHQVEGYIMAHSKAAFSHGICPDCMQKLYPEFFKETEEGFSS